MSDLKSVLERVGGSVSPRNDAFERLATQRIRHRRTRRFTAGVLALLVAAAGALATYAVFSPGAVRPAGGQDQGIPALWPEHTRTALEAAQARAEDGQDTWRLDATETAQHFARDVLGWSDAVVTVCPGQHLLDGELCTEPVPQVETFAYLAHGPAQPTLIAQLRQLSRVRPGSVWSVVRIGDAGEDLPASFELPPGTDANHPENALEPGVEVAGGQTVWLRSALAGSGATTPTVAMGYVYFDPCGPQSFGVPVQRKSVFWAAQMATSDLQRPCGNGQEVKDPVGEHLTHLVDGLLIAVASPDPSIDAAVVGIRFFGATTPTERLPEITAIAAIPVRFVPASTDPNELTADTARVSCDGQQTLVNTPLVRARPDGVHLILTNTSGQTLTFLSENELAGRGAQYGTGDSTFVSLFPPGEIRVRCLLPSQDSRSSMGWASLRIVDPDAVYGSLILDCPDPRPIGGTEVDNNLAVRAADPEDLAGVDLHGIQPADTVEVAGYSKAAEERDVIVVRDGRVIALAVYRDAATYPTTVGSGWVLHLATACEGSGIT